MGRTERGKKEMKEKVKIICWIVAIIVGIGGSMWMSYLVYNAFFVTKKKK